jgi:hypothetical protein
VLAAEIDEHRLDRNRAMLLVRLALPPTAPVERAVTWCGVPPHVLRLLSVTPSLRRSWLAGVALVLGVAVGATRVVAITPAASGSPVRLLPFLLVAPLLPLAGIAGAFDSRLDPTAALATAAPVSGIWLFCLRSVAVIAAALIPTALAAFLVPGSNWLPLLVVLPALAVSLAALALATLIGPLRAAIGAGAGWVALVAAVGLAGGPLALSCSGAAQAASLGVIIGASCLLALRRHILELGWNQ